MGSLFRLDMSSDGTAIRTRITPPLDGVVVEPDMTLIDAKCADWEKDGSYP